MARELGMNPGKLGKLDNHDQEPWKMRLREYIEHLYFKRFGKRRPEIVLSIEEKIRRLKIGNIEPLLSTGNEIPLGNDSIDLLITMNTLHEFDDKEKMVEQIKRVLKQGRTVLIADFKKEETRFGPPIAVRLSKQQALTLFENSGFTTLLKRELEYHYLLAFTKNPE